MTVSDSGLGLSYGCCKIRLYDTIYIYYYYYYYIIIYIDYIIYIIYNIIKIYYIIT